MLHQGLCHHHQGGCLFQTEVNERHSAEVPATAEAGLAGALKRALANRANQIQGGM